MKILVIHNDYGKYSGEEAVVDRFIADMRAEGHVVETLRRTSKGARDSLLGRIHGFFAGIYCAEGVRMMRQALRSFQPDVVNIHNLYPFIGPAALQECRKAGVPVVMTVHNYRLFCPTGLCLRQDSPCEECLKLGNEWPCIKHNCEKSLFRSVGYAMRNRLARTKRYYRDNVNCYCCLTQFQRNKLIQAGFDAERTAVIPNYTDMPRASAPTTSADTPQQGYIGYVGRLSQEKGYDLLLQVAAKHPELSFRFAGELRETLRITVSNNVELCGVLSKTQLADFYRRAACIVIPSRCYEGFPVALLEAFAAGKPCIVPNHGAFPQLVDNNGNPCGLLFTPNDPLDLEKKVLQLLGDAVMRTTMSLHAQQNIQAHYSRQAVLTAWQQLLSHIAAERKN